MVPPKDDVRSPITYQRYNSVRATLGLFCAWRFHRVGRSDWLFANAFFHNLCLLIVSIYSSR